MTTARRAAEQPATMTMTRPTTAAADEGPHGTLTTARVPPGRDSLRFARARPNDPYGFAAGPRRPTSARPRDSSRLGPGRPNPSDDADGSADPGVRDRGRCPRRSPAQRPVRVRWRTAGRRVERIDRAAETGDGLDEIVLRRSAA